MLNSIVTKVPKLVKVHVSQPWNQLWFWEPSTVSLFRRSFDTVTSVVTKTSFGLVSCNGIWSPESRRNLPTSSLYPERLPELFFLSEKVLDLMLLIQVNTPVLDTLVATG